MELLKGMARVEKGWQLCRVEKRKMGNWRGEQWTMVCASCHLSEQATKAESLSIFIRLVTGLLRSRFEKHSQIVAQN